MANIYPIVPNISMFETHKTFRLPTAKYHEISSLPDKDEDSITRIKKILKQIYSSLPTVPELHFSTKNSRLFKGSC